MIVVSHDGFNEVDTWCSIIVVPVFTSAEQAVRSPNRGAAAKRRRGPVALCHQVTTLDRAKLRKRLGSLTSNELTRVELGLKASLDLD